jgi:hypothetical protein
MPIQSMNSVNFRHPASNRRRPKPAGMSRTPKLMFSLPWKRSTMIVSAVPMPQRMVK